MKNKKEKYSIYKAFDSIITPDQITKQRIFNNVVNKERKKVFRFRNLAVPAVAMALLGININLLYTSVNNDSVSNNSINNGAYTEITSPLFSASENLITTKTSDNEYISEITEIPEEIIVSNTDTQAIQNITLNSVQTTIPTVTSQIITETTTVTQNILQTDIPEVTTTPEYQEIIMTTSVKNEGELLPPVSSDLQQLLEDAYEVYLQLGCTTSYIDWNTNETITIDNTMYTRTNAEYFTTLQDVTDYFSQYFTSDFLNRIDLLSKFKEYNGNIYFYNRAKGGIIGYAGHTYEITNQTDNEIDIKVTCYIANSDELITDLFFTEPDDIENYETLERSIIFKKENNEWRVDKVEIMW